MARVTAIKLRIAGYNEYYDAEDYDLSIGDSVLVETDRGLEVGEVTLPVMELDDEKLTTPLKHIERPCTKEDLEQQKENRARETEAFEICRQKISEHGLEMKLIRADYTFDRRKLTFFFSAEGRVDFRSLVKDLASEFRTRIELRQIGVRDETRILGGLGVCGRPLCCATYLHDFNPVSIKMAKEQNLSLNPTKISGLCGRLMCCLKNEEETYEYLNKSMPRRGDAAITPDGEEGSVYNVNILRQRVAVIFEKNDTREVREYDADELDFAPKGSRQLVPKPKKETSEEAGPIVKDKYQAAVQAAIERNTEEKAEREEREKQRREQHTKDRKNNNRNGRNSGKKGGGKQSDGNRQKKNDDFRRRGNASSDEQWNEYNGRSNNRRNNFKKKNNGGKNRQKNENRDKKISNGGYSSFARDKKDNNKNGDSAE
ncbi:MAG: stage 0 sporulation family protein [Candidatus Weimeria sp.]